MQYATNVDKILRGAMVQERAVAGVLEDRWRRSKGEQALAPRWAAKPR